MVDMVKDAILQLVLDHWQTVAFLLGGLMVAGMALGSLKNLVSWLLSASVKAGEKGTAKISCPTKDCATRCRSCSSS